MKKPSLNSREIPEILDSSDDEILETTPKKQKLSHETVPIKEDPDASSHQSTSALRTPAHSTSTTLHSPSTSQTQTPTPRLTSSTNDTSQGEISEKILVLMKGLGKGFINQDEYSKLFAIIADPTNQWRKALLHGLLLMEQLLETDQGKQRWELSGAKLVRSIVD
jgi:histone deacetylase complex regulatory component SIN3